jgi:Ca-activated chloride channel family protein
MTFTWPWMLLGLILIPVLVVGYRRLLLRRSARRDQLAALGLVTAGVVTSSAGVSPRAPATAARPPGGRRRHVAPALFLCALTLLLLALARPQARVTQPRREGTVVLAFDTSNSMAATDVTPTRMEAAKKAARAFVEKQPSSIRIGVVAFGGTGIITQRPTTNRADILAAIDRLAPQGGTSLARGIQTSLSAIAGRTVQLDDDTATSEGGGNDRGYYGSASVILLSDGENTDGPDPQTAADLASTAGVRIYPVGLGNPQGSVLSIDGFQIATSLNQPALQQIATTTNGTYFAAPDAQSLERVYGSIHLSWTAETKKTEITALFAAAAAVLLLSGALLSIGWFGRVM